MNYDTRATEVSRSNSSGLDSSDYGSFSVTANPVSELEACIRQFSLAHTLSSKQLHDLAFEFERCNTAVVTWLAMEAIRRKP